MLEGVDPQMQLERLQTLLKQVQRNRRFSVNTPSAFREQHVGVAAEQQASAAAEHREDFAPQARATSGTPQETLPAFISPSLKHENAFASTPFQVDGESTSRAPVTFSELVDRSTALRLKR